MAIDNIVKKLAIAATLLVGAGSHHDIYTELPRHLEIFRWEVNQPADLLSPDILPEELHPLERIFLDHVNKEYGLNLCGINFGNGFESGDGGFLREGRAKSMVHVVELGYNRLFSGSRSYIEELQDSEGPNTLIHEVAHIMLKPHPQIIELLSYANAILRTGNTDLLNKPQEIEYTEEDLGLALFYINHRPEKTPFFTIGDSEISHQPREVAATFLEETLRTSFYEGIPEEQELPDIEMGEIQIHLPGRILNTNGRTEIERFRMFTELYKQNTIVRPCEGPVVMTDLVDDVVVGYIH